MDLDDLEYHTRQKDEELERQIRRIDSRINELWETVNEIRGNINTILNRDHTE